MNLHDRLKELIEGDDRREVAPGAIRNFVKRNRVQLLAAVGSGQLLVADQNLYEVAKRITLDMGVPWTDPRDGTVHYPRRKP